MGNALELDLRPFELFTPILVNYVLTRNTDSIAPYCQYLVDLEIFLLVPGQSHGLTFGLKLENYRRRDISRSSSS
jgi:hypothetical protein